MEFYFDDIESCECIGEFNDEYVYDVEVNDETHTFVGNDILVHNSIYFSLEELIDHINETQTIEDETKFILKLYDLRIKGLIESILNKFAENGTGTVNIQNLEMENVIYRMILVAKKKYLTDKAWKSSGKDGIFYARGSKIEVKGIEMIRSSTPKFVRNKIKSLLKRFFEEGKNLNIRQLTLDLKTERELYKLSNIDDISLGSSISDYEKGVLNDRDRFEINKGCPIHVRAAGSYNYALNQSKYKNKYQLIKSGDKLKYYHVLTMDGSEEVFGYLPGNYPNEFAPPIDYDFMFAKTFITPLNSIIKVMCGQTIPDNLMIIKNLF
jgi:hypothetical protein